MPEPAFICNESDRSAWLEARQTGIGGSDCPAVLGISPFSTPAKVAAQKAGLLPPEDDDETELMAWGHKVEPLLIASFLEDMEKAGKKGWQAKPSGKLYRCSKPGQAFMLSTLDGEAVSPDGKKGVLECKLKIFGAKEWERHGVPDYVIAQTQHNVETVDASFGVVIGLLDGYRPRWKLLERSHELLTETILPAERAFWERLENGEPFPLDQGPAAVNLDLVARLYPSDNGKLVRLEGPEFLRHARQWKLAASERIGAEKREKAHKAVLRGAIGEATYGLLDNGTQLSLKTQETPASVRKGYSSRVLREDSEKTARAVQLKKRRAGLGAPTRGGT